jgi:hypothetical protein
MNYSVWQPDKAQLKRTHHAQQEASMSTRAGLLALLCLVSASVGCVGQHHTVNTVPWWKGLPCMVITPNSLEAHVWREHLHARHEDPSSCHTTQCTCDQCAEVQYAENIEPEPETP